MEMWQNIKTGETLVGRMKKTGSVAGEFIIYNKISGKEEGVIYIPFHKEWEQINLN